MSKPNITVASAADDISEDEWNVRVDLAAAYRLVARYGMTDTIANHISAAVPGHDEHFLINPYGMLYDEITASSLVKIDLEGNPVGRDAGYGVNYAGFVIHGAIHTARPDVECVVHTHTPAGIAISALECGLLPVSQAVARWERVAYHAFEGFAVDLEERATLVRDLGAANVMLLRNHGLLTVGRTTAEAFNHILQAELACQAQLKAMSCNTRLTLPSDAILRHAKEQWKASPRDEYYRLEWAALLRQLDRSDASFRN